MKLIDVTSAAFPSDSTEPSMVGWVNGNDYVRSPETFGILPLSPASQNALNIYPFSHEHALNEKIHYYDLTQLQQTRVAILPIHTPDERALFSSLLAQRSGHLASRSQPNWVSLACEWSNHANGRTIFYKVRQILPAICHTNMLFVSLIAASGAPQELFQGLAGIPKRGQLSRDSTQCCEAR